MSSPGSTPVRSAALLSIATACAFAPSALAPASASADDGGRPFTVAMTGAQEAPGPGDPDGTGTATFTINPGQREVCYTLTVGDIQPATAAHIHIAPVGEPGPVVVPLQPPTSGFSSGCADVDRALAIAIITNPSDYYVNVHNSEFPAGAVRGQLG